MTPPRWSRVLLRRVAPADRTDEVLGDLEEAHRRRVERRGPALASALTALETLDIAFALLRERLFGGSTISLLDVKLGVRMLRRYPGLSIIGGLAMAFGIWAGALTFEVIGQIVAPDLPLGEGDRIVGVHDVDVERGRPVLPSHADFRYWREALESIEELSAFRLVPRNLIIDGTVEPLEVAEMTGSGFRVARVPPLLGRTLIDSDERPDAPDVIVIGFDLWQTRLGGDPNVVGHRVRVGTAVSTVVGVMPESYGFPIHHRAWVPLRLDVSDAPRDEGSRVAVFGRLAPGVDMAEAEAELGVLAARRGGNGSETLGRGEPRVLPYARSVQPLPDVGGLGLLAANVFVVMLLVLICGNVALLMFARAVSRQSELAIRSALGAGRARIVTQLFTEALVLGGAAAVVGLVAAEVGMRWYVRMLEADNAGAIAFWIRERIAPSTVVYLCGLTVLGAVVAGVVPALKVTGRRVEARLRRATPGVAGLRLSGIWGVVIVAQVAVTVTFPVTAFFFQRYVANLRALELEFSAEEYLSVRLETEPRSEPRDAVGVPDHAMTPSFLALRARLAEEPTVLGVTLADPLPGDVHPTARIQVEQEGAEGGGRGLETHRVGRAAVDLDFFDVLGRPLRAGRDFDSGDLNPDPAVVVVNRVFVDEILEGRNAVGRRVRRIDPADGQPGPWLEVVGVSDNLGILGGDMEIREEPGLYQPLVGARESIQMAVHVRGDPDALASRLRRAAAAVDPTLRISEIRRLDRVSESRWRESEFLYQLFTGVSLVALLLSLTTIYSVTSFTASRRTREIGVRVALGSDPWRIVLSIFRDPLVKVGLGVLVGMLLVSLLVRGMLGSLTGAEMLLVGAYSALMLVVCLLACVVPTRRALGVEPTEALRAEG